MHSVHDFLICYGFCIYIQNSCFALVTPAGDRGLGLLEVYSIPQSPRPTAQVIELGTCTDPDVDATLMLLLDLLTVRSPGTGCGCERYGVYTKFGFHG